MDELAKRSCCAFDIVVIGASLGGIRALPSVTASLPAWFPATVVIAQHRRSAGRHDALPDIVRCRAALPVLEVRDGAPVDRASIYVVAPETRATVEPGGRWSVAFDGTCPTPSIDALFTSAARAYGHRTLAVLLTGRRDDGAMGVRAVKGVGGRVIAQDATTSQSFEMPRAAIATGCVDFVLPLDCIASAITSLVTVAGVNELFSVPLPQWATPGA